MGHNTRLADKQALTQIFTALCHMVVNNYTPDQQHPSPVDIVHKIAQQFGYPTNIEALKKLENEGIKILTKWYRQHRLYKDGLHRKLRQERLRHKLQQERNHVS